MGFTNHQLVYFLVIFQFGRVHGANTNINNEAKNIIVQFSPYVSALDHYNDTRYGVDELIPFISLVATRFSKFYFDIGYVRNKFGYFWNDVIPANTNSSLYNSVFAAAKYNCLSTTKQKIHVYLAFAKRICSLNDTRELALYAANVADQVNKECDKTVHTVLLKPIKERDCDITIFPFADYVQVKYNWGLVLDLNSYCTKVILPYEITNHLSVVVIDYKTEENFLSAALKKCKLFHMYTNTTFKILHTYSVYDTGIDKMVNVSHYVTSWKNRFTDLNNSYILAQAFDTWDSSCEPLASDKFCSNGWWQLIQVKNITSEYVFEEKQAVANKIDKYEDPKNYEWLHHPITFNKTSTGIVYTGNVPNEIILKDFCQLLVVDQNAFLAVKRLIGNPNASYTSCGPEFSLLIFHQDSLTYDDIVQIEKQKLVTVLLYLGRNNTALVDNIKTVDFLKSLGFQYGVTYSINFCSYPDTSFDLLQSIADANFQIINFVFDPSDYPKSTRRMFLLATELFQNCVNKIRTTGIRYSKIGFVIGGYLASSDFYTSSVYMQSFVRFIKLLNIWAEKQRYVVLFIGYDIKDDGEIHGPGGGRNVGWYFYDKYRFQYVTQREQALKLAIMQYPNPKVVEIESGLTKKETVIVVGAIIVVCATIFASVVYLVRRYYKEGVLTREELENFFEGAEPSDKSNRIEAFNVRYDKSRFEIPVGKFKIETTAVLGCGEFGKVTRGTISTASGEVSVAIKTSKSQKLEKSVLKGLMSEIKILAYVGSHDNIIKLFGANTEKLKDGQLYMFLELCHLGSLETFLRNTGTVIKSPILESVDDGTEIAMTYLNTSACSTGIILDAGLSIELYQWSVDICKGMAYLAEKHVVHADLATRNVLLNIKRQAKICDFGLSRRMHNYVESNKEHLPWKWMAPEALTKMYFNEKTDVWAYGITLWEIYSLGSTPYPGLSWDDMFVGMLEHGLKPSIPEFEEKDMYKIMKSCWKLLPQERPSFSDLVALLTSNDGCNVDYVDVL